MAIYEDAALASWNIGQTVKHLVNQGIDPDVIRAALDCHANTLKAKAEMQDAVTARQWQR